MAGGANLEGYFRKDHLRPLFLVGGGGGGGEVDPYSMSMRLPSGWENDAYGSLVRAHELVHWRLTYSTGLGIFLDLIGGLSGVKLLRILREHKRGQVLFPIEKTLGRWLGPRSQLQGHVAYCLLCESAVTAGMASWQYLQEAVAMFVMLELAPEELARDGRFSKQDIQLGLARARSEAQASGGPHWSGYRELQPAGQTLGRAHVYPAAIVASEIPLYDLRLFQDDGAAGVVLLKEIPRFHLLLESDRGNPTARFRRLVANVQKSERPFSRERKLDVFNAFAVPDLFPRPTWQQEMDEWIRAVVRNLSTFDDDAAKRALQVYHRAVETGWSPTVRLWDPKAGFLWGYGKGLEELGIFRVLLGCLRGVCVFGDRDQELRLPANWHGLGIANVIQDFMDVVTKHRLPIRISVHEGRGQRI